VLLRDLCGKKFFMHLDEIKAAIPHREPFLWVDEVVELTESKIIAKKTLDPKIDLFAGHYPAYPILPGVIGCEMTFQAAAILMSKIAPVVEGKVPVVTRVNNVQFRKIMRPGQTVQIEAELTEKMGDVYLFNGKVLSEGKPATRLEFAVTVAPME
jgi:3-hydroxyacyl-[acyl-carrier-protein] dehydratase